MKNLLLIFFYLLAIVVRAQHSDVVLFTENGEKFILSVNGQAINKEPLSRVEARSISGDFALLDVRFEEPGAPNLKKQMILDPGKELTAILKKNNKGRYVFRLINTSARISENKEETVAIVSTNSPEASPTTTKQPSESITHVSSTQDHLVSLKVKDNGSVDLSLNLPDEQWSAQNSEELSNSSGTTSQSSNITARVEGKKIVLSDGRSLDWRYVKTKSLMGVEVEMEEPAGAEVALSYDNKVAYETEVPFYYRESDWKKNKEYFKLTVREPSGISWSVKLQHSNNNRILINGLSGTGAANPTTVATNTSDGCQGMSDQAFKRAITSIENKSFADEKMTVAKQILRANCLYVEQVIEVMGQFVYEEEKIEFAKSAYRKTLDQNNYYQVNDALTYSDSVEELNRFLASQ